MSGIRNHIYDIVLTRAKESFGKEINRYSMNEFEDHYLSIFQTVISEFRSQNLMDTAAFAEELFIEHKQYIERQREYDISLPERVEKAYERFPTMLTDKEWLDYWFYSLEKKGLAE